MNEDVFLDRLTGIQDAKTPDWDYASRVATCHDAIIQENLSVLQARKVFGDDVFGDALTEILKSTGHRSAAAPATPDGTFVASPSVVVTEDDLKAIDYPDFDKPSRLPAAVMAVVALLAVGSLSWLVVPARTIEVNSDIAKSNDMTKPLVFSVPDTSETEAKLRSEVESASAAKSAGTLKNEIEQLRDEVEDKIIALEALKRVYSRFSGRTSEAVSSGNDANRSATYSAARFTPE